MVCGRRRVHICHVHPPTCRAEELAYLVAVPNLPGRRAGPPMRDDLVDRQFTAEAANQLWPADITEHWIGEGKVYRCARAGEAGRIAHRRLSPRSRVRA
jgi:transposase InsO family protein